MMVPADVVSGTVVTLGVIEETDFTRSLSLTPLLLTGFAILIKLSVCAKCIVTFFLFAVVTLPNALLLPKPPFAVLALVPIPDAAFVPLTFTDLFPVAVVFAMKHFSKSFLPSAPEVLL